MNKIRDEEKALIKWFIYGDLIKKYIQSELDILDKHLSLGQTIRVINQALELDNISEFEINHLILKELKR